MVFKQRVLEIASECFIMCFEATAINIVSEFLYKMRRIRNEKRHLEEVIKTFTFCTVCSIHIHKRSVFRCPITGCQQYENPNPCSILTLPKYSIKFLCTDPSCQDECTRKFELSKQILVEKLKNMRSQLVFGFRVRFPH